MPRPENPEIRRRLLTSGLELIYARGVNGTGVKEITDLAGVPKGTFYTYYDSKEAFVVAVLEFYWLELQSQIGPLLGGRGAPLQRLERYFTAIADDHEHHAFMLGCLVGNLALEVSVTSSAASEKLRRILAGWEEQLAGTLPTGSPRERREAACLLIEAWEGAVFRAKVDRSREPYDRFVKVTLRRVVDALGASR